MSAHTATPWHVNEDGDVAVMINGIESVIAQPLTHRSIERMNYRENAEFIVRACNAHDDLVSALKLIIECKGIDAENIMRKYAIAALAKAGAA